MPPEDPSGRTGPRRRGRPSGGGNTAEEAKAVLLEAAERSILHRGFQSSTMEIIAHEAGYSRAAVYQHFPNRQRLLEALVRRQIRRCQDSILARIPENASLAEILVESMVNVSTELIHDPLLQTMSEATDEGTVARLIARDSALPELVEQLVDTLRGGNGEEIRPGLRPGEVGQFIISTAITMLLGVIPGIDQPDTARRYVRTFVLPAILTDPPPPQPVFDEPSG